MEFNPAGEVLKKASLHGDCINKKQIFFSPTEVPYFLAVSIFFKAQCS